MKRMTLSLLLPLALGLGALCVLGASAAGSESVAPVVQTTTVEPTSAKADAAPGNASEIQGYGQRESQNPGLSEFAGGHHDDVVIVAGAVIVALVLAAATLRRRVEEGRAPKATRTSSGARWRRGSIRLPWGCAR